jgi:DHA1 family inner membrane transport protein
MLAAVGMIAGVALQLWMPTSRRSESSSLRREIVALRRPQVLLAMAMSLLVCASTFAVFTFVAPLLIEETRISVGALPIMLLLFGVGGAAGMVVGGRLGDWKPLESIAALSLAYALFYLGLMTVIDSAALVGAAMILWGFLFLAPCVPLQTRVVRKAIDGPNLASTLNQSAFNVGNALGPTLGAIALSLGFEYRALPWIGSVLALLCAATALWSRALEGDEAVLVSHGHPRAPR